MDTFRHIGAAPAVFAVLMLAVTAADAQTARSGGSVNAQLLQQLQQLASDRTALQADNARMKKELDDLRRERDELKKRAQAMERRTTSSAAELARSAAQREAVERDLSETREKMQELIAKFRETVQTLRQIEAEDVTAKQTLAARDQELKVCVERNLALYKLNGEVLTRLEHGSGWSRLARAEPFTKIKRVQLENLIGDYKSQAEDQRVNPRGTGASPSSPTGREPAAPATSAPQPNDGAGR